MVRSRHRSRAKRWFASVTALALVAVAGLIPAALVAAADPPDAVLVWNEHAVRAIGNAPTATPPGLGQPPPLAPIHLAMVHGAIYDAVNAIDGGHEPYLDGLPSAPPSASKAAAVATAARDVLVALPPGSAAVTASVDGIYADYLLGLDSGPATEAGIAIGHAAAAAMIADRVDDGRFVGTPLWPIGTLPGTWRPVETANANVFAWIANVDPFTMTSTSQFRTEGPLDLASPEYAAEFNQVKALGANDSVRTVEQNLLAGFVSANPFPYSNRGLREIAAANGLSTTEQALLFVKATMSTADALIGCWDDKEHWLFWRPQTAIRLAATDGNPATVAQLDWTAMFQSPGYPDHPSGFNCFAGAMWHSARQFFGTDMQSFQLTSPGSAVLPGSTRSYTRFTDVIDDAIEGRMLMGIHFRTPDVQGAWLGKKVAQWVDKHYFAPVD